MLTTADRFNSTQIDLCINPKAIRNLTVVHVLAQNAYGNALYTMRNDCLIHVLAKRLLGTNFILSCLPGPFRNRVLKDL